MLGIRVLGVSLDGVTDQARFHREEELNVPLLSEPDASAAAKYGVLPEGSSYAKRVTFVIDDEGVLRSIERDVQVNTHGEDLVLRVEELMFE